MTVFESRYPFTAIPNWIIRKQFETPGGWLSNNELCVLITLQFFADGAGSSDSVEPCYDAICSCANISRATAADCVSSLRQKGLVEKTVKLNQGGRPENIYRLKLWEVEKAPAPTAPPPCSEPAPIPPRLPASTGSPKKFAAVNAIVPVKLQAVDTQICSFFNSHKGGSKAKVAFDGLIDNLLRIERDPDGGIDEVKAQLREAIERSTAGEKKWISITYSNWKKFGKKNKPPTWGQQFQGGGRPSAVALVSKFDDDQAAVLNL
jgi:hypothetical protein